MIQNSGKQILFVFIFFPVLCYQLQQCKEGSNNCDVCIRKYDCIYCRQGSVKIVNGSESICQECSFGCQNCFPMICYGCYSGFQLTMWGTCQCPLGKGVNIITGICNFCADPHCTMCHDNFQICISCESSYSVFNNSCVSCSVNSCLTCPNFQICTSCQTGLGLLNNNCVSCSDPNCEDCSLHFQICRRCKQGFGYGIFSNVCQACNQSNCTSCFDSKFACQSCLSPLGSDGTTCLPCNDLNCLNCNVDNMWCVLCSPGFGLDPSYSFKGNCTPCRTSHCQECNQDYTKCTLCLSSFNLNSYYCSNCSLSFCTECDTGIFSTDIICKACALGHGLNGSECVPCALPNCNLCSLNYQICIGCSAGFGYNSTQKLCIACIDVLCVQCSLDPNICTACSIWNGLNGTTCSYCEIGNCMFCSKNSKICSSCGNRFGLDPTGLCMACQQIGCEICSQNYRVCSVCKNGYAFVGRVCKLCNGNFTLTCSNFTSNPTSCIFKYGPSSPGGECIPCADTNCLSCPEDYRKCITCNSYYGPNASAQCELCQQLNCKLCSHNSTTCTLCAKGFATNGVKCFPCNDSNCVFCALHSFCIICDLGFSLVNGTCSGCPNNCFSCINPTTCSECSPGFGFNSQNECTSCDVSCTSCNPLNVLECFICADSYYLWLGECQSCPNGCNTFQPISPPVFQCFSCTKYFYLNVSVSPSSCFQICGDNWVFDLACDLGVGVNYDGCTNECEIENQFECRKNSNRSICSYNGSVNFTFISIERIINSNELKLIVSVFPPLKVFADYSVSEVFTIDQPSVKVNQITYDSQSSSLTFVAAFDSLFIFETNITVSFKPIQSVNERYYASVQSSQTFEIPATNEDFIFYSSAELSLIKSLALISYITLVLAWFSFVLGFLLKRLPGIQIMMLLQYIYLNILWLNSNMIMPLYNFIPLKFSTGYNQIFFPSQQSGESAPFTFQFSLSTISFIGNFNLMLIVQLIPVLVFGVLGIKMKCLSDKLEKSEDSDQADEMVEKMAKLEQQKFLFLQLTLYFTMFNVLNLINCTIIYLSTNSLNFVNILFVLLGFVILSFNVVKFIVEPHPFGFFRYSFRILKITFLQSLCFNQSILYCFLLSISFLLFSLVPRIPILPFAFIAVFTIYTIALRPYSQNRYNVLSSLNLLTLSLITAFRVYCQQSANKTEIVFLIFITLSLLPFCVALLTTICLIYELIFKICLKKKLEEEQENSPQGKRKLAKSGVLQKLQVSQTRTKMKDVKQSGQNNIFKKIIEPKVNLLDYSNTLCVETLREQQQMFRTNNKCPINFQALYQAKANNIVKLEIEMTPIGDKKNQQHKQQNNQNNQTLQRSHYQYELPILAKQVLVEQNKYVRFKGSYEYIEKKKINRVRNISPTKNIYLKAYDDLEKNEWGDKEQSSFGNQTQLED